MLSKGQLTLLMFRDDLHTCDFPHTKGLLSDRGLGAEEMLNKQMQVDTWTRVRHMGQVVWVDR